MTFGFQMWDSDVYYVTSLPQRCSLAHGRRRCHRSLSLTGLATIYPGVRASRVEPAEALGR